MNARCHILALLFFLCFDISLKGQHTGKDSLAQLPFNPRVIKTSPLALIWSQIPLTSELRIMYETRIKENSSSIVGVSYIFKSPITQYILESYNNNNPNLPPLKLNINGIRLQGMQRFYILKNYFSYTDSYQPQGLFIGPHFSINSATFKDPRYPGTYVSLNYLNINILGGIQFMVGPIAFEAAGGLGYRNNFSRTVTGAGSGAVQQNLTNVLNDNVTPFLPPNLKISFITNVGYNF